MSKVFGGYYPPGGGGASECSVTCKDGPKSKDCGRGVPCVTKGTTIQCGTDQPEEMCTAS